MNSHHKYVFDVKRKKFIGDFDRMYRNENKEGFDSWGESNLMTLRKAVSLTLLNTYTFRSVLDAGCGKGMFTQFLKKYNNRVVGVDISKSAVSRARIMFPEIDFRCLDINVLNSIKEKFDLVVAMGVLIYVKEWRDILKVISLMTRYFYVAEYIPPRSIGFVKSPEDLIREVKKNFVVIHKVFLDDQHYMLFTEIKRPRRG